VIYITQQKLQLPRTMNGKQIPVQQRLAHVQQLLAPGSKLDLFIRKTLAQYVPSEKEIEQNALNAKEKNIVQYRLDAMWRIVEEIASYLLFLQKGKSENIQSERTKKRIDGKRANYPIQENNSIYDVQTASTKDAQQAKADYGATNKMYRQSKLNNNQYTDAEFDTDMNRIMTQQERQAIYLLGHGNSQEEVADEMGISRDKLRTLRKRIASKYNAYKAGQSIEAKPDAGPSVMQTPRRKLPKGWVCANKFFEKNY